MAAYTGIEPASSDRQSDIITIILIGYIWRCWKDLNLRNTFLRSTVQQTAGLSHSPTASFLLVLVARLELARTLRSSDFKSDLSTGSNIRGFMVPTGGICTSTELTAVLQTGGFTHTQSWHFGDILYILPFISISCLSLSITNLFNMLTVLCCFFCFNNRIIYAHNFSAILINLSNSFSMLIISRLNC